MMDEWRTCRQQLSHESSIFRRINFISHIYESLFYFLQFSLSFSVDSSQHDEERKWIENCFLQLYPSYVRCTFLTTCVLEINENPSHAPFKFTQQVGELIVRLLVERFNAIQSTCVISPLSSACCIHSRRRLIEVVKRSALQQSCSREKWKKLI